MQQSHPPQRLMHHEGSPREMFRPRKTLDKETLQRYPLPFIREIGLGYDNRVPQHPSLKQKPKNSSLCHPMYS